MKKILIIFGFVLIFFTSSASAQILSPVAHLEASIGTDTITIFVGKTQVIGDFQGYNIDSEFIPENPFLSKIKAFPLFGSVTLENINSVIIIDLDEVDIDSFKDLSDFNIDNISRFSNVDIVAENTPVFLGSESGSIHIESTIEFALSSFVELDIGENSAFPFLALLTPSYFPIQYLGETSALLQMTNTTSITLHDAKGEVEWEGGSRNTIIIIEDESYLISSNSPLFLLPIHPNVTNQTFDLTVSPARSTSVDYSSLIEEVISITEEFEDIQNVSQKIQEYKQVIIPASDIINGGMILVGTNDSILIDDNTQKFTGFGFARGNTFDVGLSSGTQEISIKGEYRLIFLGDHFYTIQAQNSEQGVAFPFLLVAIWIAAIGLLVFVKFFYKKESNLDLDQKIQQYSLPFHLIMLIIVFILMDREITFQFGVSLIDILIGHGFSPIFLFVIVLEVIIWIFGFILLAIPLRITAHSCLTVLGIKESGKGIEKGIGSLGIWIFCSFYVKFIINIFLLFFHPGYLIPMG
jgi:hypothetical protein